MLRTPSRWILVAALAAGMSGAALAGDGGAGDGGDSGDSSMNPIYGDSWAELEGNGHNLGYPTIAPNGAYAAHEMDGLAGLPLSEQWRRMKLRAAEMSEKMRQESSQMFHSSSGTPSTGDAQTAPAMYGHYRIAPINPKGQAPTIIGPEG